MVPPIGTRECTVPHRFAQCAVCPGWHCGGQKKAAPEARLLRIKRGRFLGSRYFTWQDRHTALPVFEMRRNVAPATCELGPVWPWDT
jgi:hypothetical protein